MLATIDAGTMPSNDDAGPPVVPPKDAGTGGAIEDAGKSDAGTASSDAGGSMPDAGGGLPDAGPPPTCTPTDLSGAMGAGVATGSTVGAPDLVTPSCDSGGADVAYLWRAPHDGTFTFTTNGSDYDTVLSLRMGSTCTGAELDCDDDAGEDVRSRLDATFVTGDEVVIVIEGYGGDAGNYTLAILDGAPVAEAMCTDAMDEDLDGNIDCDDTDCDTDPTCTELDCANGADDDGDGLIDCVDYDCSTAMGCGETLCSDGTDEDTDGVVDCADTECACDMACLGADPCPQTDLGSVVGAGVATGSNVGLCSYRDGTCGGYGGGVTFRWTAPSAGTFTIDTVGSSYDTVLYALDGSCGGAELACDDDTHMLQSEIMVTATAGQVIVIALDAYDTTSAGSYVLNITGP